MNREARRTYLLSKPGATEERPFGPQPLVVKVGGKLFALLSEHAAPLEISRKCEPAHVQFLRDAFPAVKPGPHLNTRTLEQGDARRQHSRWGIQAMIDESCALVVKGLRKAARHHLEQM